MKSTYLEERLFCIQIWIINYVFGRIFEDIYIFFNEISGDQCILQLIIVISLVKDIGVE